MILVETKVDSEFIRIPELKDFLGKDVTITIMETPKINGLKNFFDAVGNIDIDSIAVEDLRKSSLI